MATKKRRARKASGGRTGRRSDPLARALSDTPIAIQLPEDPEAGNEDGKTISINSETGSVIIDQPDGSIVIDNSGEYLNQATDEDDTVEASDHDANLATKIDAMERTRIAEDLMVGIEADRQDCQQFLMTRAKCVELTGMKLEDPKGDVSRSAMGMSVSSVRDSTLLQAVEFFRANAYNELCPASGPVKVTIAGDQEESPDKQDLADSLQADLNYYLTVTASEYYKDMYWMLWWTGLSSGTFKKVYYDPMRRRPVSECVDASKLLVSASAQDLRNAARVTQIIKMKRSVMKRMQLLKIYREIPFQTDPLQQAIDTLDEKKAQMEGIAVQPQRPEDQEFTVYECYTELDLKGFEHKERGKPSGLPLPYRVVIDETTREVLAIHRNWAEDDPDMQAEIPYILFPFSTGLSRLYGSGLGQMMGNMASAMTALTRICVDNGMYGNFPATVKQKGPDRQIQNEIMAPPGGTVEIDTGGVPIQDFIMPLPYKDISGNVAQFIEQLRGVAKELGGIANMPIGEGKQEAPVGTTLALIEQSTKPASATHKILWAAQCEEFRALIRIFKMYPESLWMLNRRPKLGGDLETRLARFKKALEDCDIEPQADPNVPSEMHRKLLAMAMKQMTQDNPAYNQVEVDRYIFKRVFKMPDAEFNRLLAGPQPGPQPDPVQMGMLHVKQMDAQTKRMQVMSQAQQAKAKLASDEQVAAAKLGQQHAAATYTAPPSPLEYAELGLKQQKLNQEGQNMHFQAYNEHADRDARQTEKAMEIASRLATHPESQPAVNSELQGLHQFLTPAHSENPQPGSASGLSSGGRANYTPEHLNEAIIQRALELTQALQDMRGSRIGM